MSNFSFSGIVICVVALLVLFFIFKRIKRKGQVSSSGNQIYVGNLSYSMREAQLREEFESFGNISALRIITQGRTNRSKGFGFVTYKSEKSAQKALAAHGRMVKGRTIVVRIAKQKD